MAEGPKLQCPCPIWFPTRGPNSFHTKSTKSPGGMSLPLKGDSFLAGTLRRVPGSWVPVSLQPLAAHKEQPTVTGAHPTQHFQGTATKGPAFAGAPRALRGGTVRPGAVSNWVPKGPAENSAERSLQEGPAPQVPQTHCQGLALQKLFRLKESLPTTTTPTLGNWSPHSSFLERSPQASMSFSDEAPGSRPARK